MNVKFNGGRNLLPSKSLRSCVGERGGLRVIVLYYITLHYDMLYYSGLQYIRWSFVVKTMLNYYWMILCFIDLCYSISILWQSMSLYMWIYCLYFPYIHIHVHIHVQYVYTLNSKYQLFHFVPFHCETPRHSRRPRRPTISCSVLRSGNCLGWPGDFNHRSWWSDQQKTGI